MGQLTFASEADTAQCKKAGPEGSYWKYLWDDWEEKRIKGVLMPGYLAEWSRGEGGGEVGCLVGCLLVQMDDLSNFFLGERELEMGRAETRRDGERRGCH
jgi:hypothetical protein